MAELSLICLALYAVTSLVVGTRLIARSWRSRGLPELLIGCTYAVASGSRYPLSVVAPYLPGRSATLAAMIVAQVLIVLGCSAFAFFNAKVFRPNSSWSVPVAALGSLVFAGSGLGVIAAFLSAPEGALAAESARSATAVFLFALVACQTWTALEGLRYYRMMKRRLALGLADAVVTNRFLLWGISGAISVTWKSGQRHAVSCPTCIPGLVAVSGKRALGLQWRCLLPASHPRSSLALFMPPILLRILQLLFLVLIQAVLLFAGAGSFSWPAAWWYLGLYLFMLVAASLVMIPRRRAVIDQEYGDYLGLWHKRTPQRTTSRVRTPPELYDFTGEVHYYPWRRWGVSSILAEG